MKGHYWRTARANAFGWAIDGENYFRAVRDAMDRAEREIIIIGWDIDSRFELIRDNSDPYYPSPICETLESLADKKPGLNVYILSWDFAIVYAMEREFMPGRSFGWQDSERLHFHLDGEHATGASHHQKIVIIDGVLAFSGGLDLTKDRWDTRRHAANDARRVDPDGNAYRPFHDVQAIVTGDAARSLRELASGRWEIALGEPLPALDAEGDAESLWPDGLEVQAEDVEVAIARTVGKSGDDGIREVEQSYLEMIASAKRSIYIENQYFTSESIANALAERLADDDPPEIVLVLPSETSGWLEQATMDVLRNRGLARLREADRQGRLRVVSPSSRELEDAPITVHAKIMIVDNRWLRIGSANLSGRSMGLDTECDLIVEHEAAATDLCADLLAEHMGAEFDEVRAGLASDGLLATLRAFNDGERWLDKLEPDFDETEQAMLEPIAKIADLEKPITMPTGGVADGEGDTASDADDEMHTPAAGWAALALIVVVIGFWVFVAVQGSGEDLDFGAILNKLRDAASHPLAPFAAVPAIVLGSVMVAPITGMLAVCALLFDPWTASIVGIVGTLAATGVNHWIGGHFARVISKKIPDRISEKISRVAKSSDVLSLAGLRLIPIAPFSIVNLVLGVSGVDLRKFLLGTLIGMGPGIVLLCMSVDRARAALAGESVFDPWIIAVIAAAGILLIGLRTWQKRR
jgi:phosphatidylserine/phosphatidylglycerophosphate/cardiolipin synthase-like enzyme/uncharacterized membrane protein YdjX (TVP38/TMEM64 family)